MQAQHLDLTARSNSIYSIDNETRDLAESRVICEDIHAARRFLDLLAPGGRFTFQTFDDGPERRSALARIQHGTLTDRFIELTDLASQGAGVFVTANETDLNGRKATNVTAIRAVFVDLDGSPLEPVLAGTLSPHIVVQSSPDRWHAYWLVQDFPLEMFTPVQKAIAARYGGDAKVCDLPRVMRLPGFFHRKSTPFMTGIHEIDDAHARYTEAEIVAAFPPLPKTPSRTSLIESRPLMGAVIPEGTRNNALTRLAGSMRQRGMNEGAISEQLSLVNMTRCEPPLSSGELDVIARSVVRYPPGTTEWDKSMSDVGNANRFVRDWGENLRYVHGMGKWLHWDTKRWVTDDIGSVIEMAKKTATGIYEEAASAASIDSAIAARMAKHASVSLNEARIHSMVKLAQSQSPIPAKIETFDDNDNLLGTAAATIDLVSGAVLSPSREHLITKQSPVLFEPGADCPIFKSFLDKIMNSNTDLIEFLQRAVGYSLTGDTSEHGLFFLYGGGSNGKSTFINVLKDLMGDYAMHCQPETLMLKRTSGGANNDIARLVGARVVLTTEVEEGSHLAENLIKGLTGGDTLTARPLYKEFFDFKPRLKLWIAGNNKPIIRGTDHGIWRRIRLVPFNVTIRDSEKDMHLAAKLRTEMPGILNWALAGCAAWRKEGLKPPTEILLAVSEYKSENDITEQWLNEQCVRDCGRTLRVSTAYSDYRAWAERSGYHPLSKIRFGRKLTEHGIKKTHTEAGDQYQDLALSDDFATRTLLARTLPRIEVGG